jgi:heme exporter protein C
MHDMRNVLLALGVAGLCLNQWFIWSYAPVEATMGLTQKIFYFHLPLAWWGMVSFFTVFVAGFGYLWKRWLFFDLVAGAAAEVGVVFATLALVTGSLWGKAAWNVWWTWDPRLTTTLIMWFIYLAYLVLRSSGLGSERRRLVSAVLGIVAFLDVPLVFYSARIWRSIHPSVIASREGGLDPQMWHAVLSGVAAWAFVWVVLLWLRHAQLWQAQRLEARVRFE